MSERSPKVRKTGSPKGRAKSQEPGARKPGSISPQQHVELDALIAAPQHHKLLFENEFVRVLDANIPAGEMTALHTHSYAASHIVISWSDFIRYDAAGGVLLDSRSLGKTILPHSALWSEPLGPHALKNVGAGNLHIISVEIKPKADE